MNLCMSHQKVVMVSHALVVVSHTSLLSGSEVSTIYYNYVQLVTNQDEKHLLIKEATMENTDDFYYTKEAMMCNH